MRGKSRTHRLVAALCAVPFLVFGGAGAASALPATAPAAAPVHVQNHDWRCDYWTWNDWDCDAYYGHGYHGLSYSFSYDSYGFGYGGHGYGGGGHGYGGGFGDGGHGYGGGFGSGGHGGGHG